MPADIIAALTTMFNLDDDEAEKMDIALVGMLGDGVQELKGTREIAVA